MERAVIALDVDGTLFDGHSVARAAVAELERVHADGHLLVIVTGRRWETLSAVIGSVLPLFDRVVGEEGGYLVNVERGELRLLAPALEPSLVVALHDAGVEDLDIGRVVVSGSIDDIDAFVAVCHRVGGDRRVVINKRSVAIVPNGHDKGTGLHVALTDLGATSPKVVAIGDAANDLPMFAVADVALGVANADESERAAGIELTCASFGDGVAEALRRYLPTV